MRLSLLLLSLFITGCINNTIIPSNKVILRMSYTNELGIIINGYFVPDARMIDFVKMKHELDYYKELESKQLLK